MRSPALALSFVIIALTLMGSGKRSGSPLISVHLETSEQEYPKFATAVKMGEPAQQYFFQILPVLTDRDILWYYNFIAEDNTWGVAFQLNDRGTEMLKRVSIDPTFAGKLLVINVAALSKKEPGVQGFLQIDRPVSDGVLVIWKGLSEKHLRVLSGRFPNAKDIQGR